HVPDGRETPGSGPPLNDVHCRPELLPLDHLHRYLAHRGESIWVCGRSVQAIPVAALGPRGESACGQLRQSVLRVADASGRRTAMDPAFAAAIADIKAADAAADGRCGTVPAACGRALGHRLRPA